MDLIYWSFAPCRPSVRFILSKLTSKLSQFFMCSDCNKFCKHYSKIVRRWIFIFIYIVSHTLKLCTSVGLFIGPSYHGLVVMKYKYDWIKTREDKMFSDKGTKQDCPRTVPHRASSYCNDLIIVLLLSLFYCNKQLNNCSLPPSEQEVSENVHSRKMDK